MNVPCQVKHEWYCINMSRIADDLDVESKSENVPVRYCLGQRAVDKEWHDGVERISRLSKSYGKSLKKIR